MKATGLTRQIDDLGRVVIPREVRMNMKIREGDPLEVYVDHVSNMVCFKLVKPIEISSDLQRCYDAHVEDLTEVEKELFNLLLAKVEDRTNKENDNG